MRALGFRPGAGFPLRSPRCRSASCSVWPCFFGPGPAQAPVDRARSGRRGGAGNGSGVLGVRGRDRADRGRDRGEFRAAGWGLVYRGQCRGAAAGLAAQAEHERAAESCDAPFHDRYQLADIHYFSYARRAVGVKCKQHVITGQQDTLIAGQLERVSCSVHCGGCQRDAALVVVDPMGNC